MTRKVNHLVIPSVRMPEMLCRSRQISCKISLLEGEKFISEGIRVYIKILYIIIYCMDFVLRYSSAIGKNVLIFKQGINNRSSAF